MKTVMAIFGGIALVGGIGLFFLALTTVALGQANLYAVLSVAAFVFTGLMMAAAKLD